MEERYQLRYRGRLTPGTPPEHAVQQLARLFNMPEAKARTLVAHDDMLVKKDIDRASALDYQARLHQAGLETEMEALSAPTAAPGPIASSTPAREQAQPSPPAMPGPPAGQAETPQRLPFEFTGQAGEFFKIWLTNIVLSILTLGIYSAWAKVRTNRYFYANTRVADSSFDYLANPISILKGRALAVAVLAVLAILVKLVPATEPLVNILILILVPWIVVRALRFHYRNSAYRHIRFGFDGQYGEAIRAFILWPVAAVFSLGLLMPLAFQRQKRFLVDNARYGTRSFDFSAEVRAFYRVVLISGLLLVPAVIFTNVMIMDTVQEMQAMGPEAMESDPGLAQSFMVSIWLAGGIMAVGFIAAYAYFSARMANLVFNHSELQQNRFESTLTPLGLGGILLSNWLVIALTLGLARPWAMVRQARYRAANLSLLAGDGLDEFVAAEGERVNAVGEELGEAFDVDVGV